MKRAENYDDIRPLIQFCKDGRVLEALQWARDGKPLDPPPIPPKSARKRSPLQYAIESGCHSMVQVLLEGGAEVEQNARYDALLDAVRWERLDLIKLLVEHGADVRRINMCEVFCIWDPAIIEFFIERGRMWRPTTPSPKHSAGVSGRPWEYTSVSMRGSRTLKGSWTTHFGITARRVT